MWWIGLRVWVQNCRCFTGTMQLRMLALHENQRRVQLQLHCQTPEVTSVMSAALRRALMDGVATVAIDRVSVAHNTSGVQTEALVHALGFVTLHSQCALPNDLVPPEVVSLPFPGECSVCTGGEPDCAACGVHFTLEAMGPCVVRARDLRRTGTDRNFVVPHCPNAKLFVLRQGEEVHLTCTAHKGVGATHAKWSPVCPAACNPVLGTLDVEVTGALTCVATVAAALAHLQCQMEQLRDACVHTCTGTVPCVV